MKSMILGNYGFYEILYNDPLRWDEIEKMGGEKKKEDEEWRINRRKENIKINFKIFF